MVIPCLDEYSQQQLDQASKACPAIERYLVLLKNSPQQFEDSLRLERHTSWLQASLAVYFQNTPPEEVCAFWSQSADKLLIKAWRHIGLQNHNLCLFALGKLGSNELNLSSDVDLIVIGSPENPEEATRALKQFKKVLNDHSEFGFALRVDFDLRPDGAWGPLIISIPHFQDHYWSRGETWERLAMIRLRKICGPEELVSATYDLANRFCYRKYLDYTLMEDLKSLRARIHAKTFRSSDNVLDLKLCIGGIRDAELFIHSLQVIHGGRNPSLRTTNTSEACRRLSSALPENRKSLDRLLELYWTMRNLENQVQIHSDEQTHNLNESGPYPVPADECWTLAKQTTTEINQIVSTLLGTLDHSSNQLPKNLDSQIRWLKDLGYSDPVIEKIWPEIIKASALSHRKDRDENARKDFLFTFVTSLAEQSPNRDLALSVFLDFIRSIRAKSTLFNLILRNNKLLNRLVVLFAHSPYMGQVIASRPELIDSFLYGQHELSDDTEESLQLLFEKRQLSEIHAAIAFFENKEPLEVSQSLSATADTIASSLREIILQEVLGSSFEILCLGKWGSKEMGFNSDLDFVLIKDGEINPDDHRASKRFINFMTSSQRGGKIYEIDMRLRPSGSKGPLLVTKDNLYEYLKNKAEPWERQSYLKMRPLSSMDLWSRQILIEKPLTADDLKELARIRSQLLRPTTEKGVDIKYAPGGLIELEFAVQTDVLNRQIPSEQGSTLYLLKLLADCTTNWSSHYSELESIYISLRKWEQLLRLTTQSSSTLIATDGDPLRRMAVHLNTDSQQAFLNIQNLLMQSQQILKILDPIYTQD